MSTRIRLQRKGSKKQPVYRIVITNREAGASAGYIEKIGNYDPESDSGDEVTLDRERATHWLDSGAEPSTTVRNILSDEGILEELREEQAVEA